MYVFYGPTQLKEINQGDTKNAKWMFIIVDKILEHRE